MDQLNSTQLFNLSLSEGYLLLDIRRPEEYILEHVTGSFSMPINLDRKELEERYQEILNWYQPEILNPIIFIGPPADLRDIFLNTSADGLEVDFSLEDLYVLLKLKFSFVDDLPWAYFRDLESWPSFLTSDSTTNKIRNIVEEFELLQPYPSRILSNIYLGSRYDAYNKDIITNLGITHILSLNWDTSYHSGVSQMNYCIEDADEVDIIRAYCSVRDFMDRACTLGRLLIHCDKGRSRSVSILILFLNEKLNQNYEELLLFVKEKRKIAQPNPGFTRQIKNYISGRRRNCQIIRAAVESLACSPLFFRFVPSKPPPRKILKRSSNFSGGDAPILPDFPADALLGEPDVPEGRNSRKASL